MQIKNGASSYTVPFLLLDSSGNPITGKVYSDIVFYASKNSAARALRALGSNDLIEWGDGWYGAKLGAGDFDTNGPYRYWASIVGSQIYPSEVDYEVVPYLATDIMTAIAAAQSRVNDLQISAFLFGGHVHQNSAIKSILRLTDGNGAGVTGVVAGSVTVTIIRPDGSTRSYTPAGGDWSELTGGFYVISFQGTDFGVLGTQLAEIAASGARTTLLTFLVQAKDSTDIAALLGTPAGASVSADVAAVKSDTAAVVIAAALIKALLGDNALLDQIIRDPIDPDTITSARMRAFATSGDFQAAFDGTGTPTPSATWTYEAAATNGRETKSGAKR